MTPSNRSAVELSKEDPVSDAPSRENFNSAGGKTPLPVLHRAIFLKKLGHVEFLL